MDNIEKKCIHFYNSLYNSFINKVPYTIYMNNFLDNMIELLNINRVAFIVDYDSSSNSLYNLILARKEIKSSNEQFNISINPILNLNNTEGILSKVIETKKYIYKNNIIYTEIFGNKYNISNFNFKINTFIIPILFDNNIKGILGFITTTKIDLDIYKNILNLQYMLGTFFYTLKNNDIVIKDTYSQNKFLVYQIIGDILNLIDDSIILLNNRHQIVYYNENLINLIKIDNILLNQNIKNVFNIFDSILNENESQFFKNKKIEIIKNNIIILGYINSVIINNNIFNIIILKKKENKEQENNEIINKNILACFSHELRNPLQLIINACFILDTKILLLKDKDNNKYNEICNESINLTNILNKSCNNIKILIDDIINLSEINSKQFNIHINKCYIKSFISDIFYDFNHLISKKNLNLDLIIDNNLPDILYTDDTRLYQIISNLLENSIKYSNNGTIKITLEYNVIENGINFIISDQGCGIKNTEISNIFKLFGKTSNSFHNNSNGIGLYLCQKIANILGGYISFVTEYKKGSIFTFFHPLNLKSINNNIIKNYTPPISGNILIINNNAKNNIIFKLLLESFNYKFNFNLNIQILNNDIDIINYLKKNNKYDIIFIDINMSIYEDFEVIKILNKLRKDSIYINSLIAITGDILIKQKPIFQIFNDIIIKPYTTNILLKILNKYILKK